MYIPNEKSTDALVTQKTGNYRPEPWSCSFSMLLCWTLRVNFTNCHHFVVNDLMTYTLMAYINTAVSSLCQQASALVVLHKVIKKITVTPLSITAAEITATWLFIHQPVHANNYENTEALHHWPFIRWSGGCLNINMSSYQYRDPHIKDKTVSRPSHL